MLQSQSLVSNSVAAVANASSNSLGRIYQVNISNTGQGYIAPNATISAPSPVTFNASTDVSSGDDFISIPSNVFQNNDVVKYLVAAGNTAVSGLANNTSYYVVSANSTGVKLSSTLNGSAINLTASGTSETGHSLTGNTATATVVVDTNKITTAYGIVTFANSSVVRLTNVYGIFVTGNSSTSVLTGNTTGYVATCDLVTQPTTYFDQTYKVVGTMQSNEFIEDELVTQASTNGNGYFYAQSGTGANPRTVKLVNKRGTINQSDLSVNYTIDGVTSGAKMLVSGLAQV